ncbi:hypothetical protein MY494_10935 [Synechococcus sp. A10-1-5-1]|uniref:hypothetical protein n=1 Tax=Synechococcus sp. A10-1-5-1 TaxID=2936507 RepID=UPI002000EF3B|nr:hypothetical protein [Synechococcus sp. A10-1-5-1]UPM49825.1 hypothetical protein MY494_10935 [Synechococcus sp. A10-1-5-1]
MNDYQLGVKLRRQILADFERGISSDARRYQALLSDFCGDSELLLLPALKHLVQTAAFQEAAAERPPLPGETQLNLRLQQELDALFAPALCLRMAEVLRGLLGLAPDGQAIPSIEVQDDVVDQPITAVPRSNSGLVAVLSFIAGVLVVGVVGALTWLVLLNRSLTPSTAPAPALVSAPEPTTTEPEPATTEPKPDPAQLQLNQAIETVRQLYDDISLGNSAAAKQLFSPQAADQFDPAFFSQFQRVAVDSLQEVSRDGSKITLQGVVTFVYPDGTSQAESRSFTVDTATQPGLITASSFDQVVSPRR